MYIRFSTSKEAKAMQDLLNLRIEVISACPASAGFFGLRSSNLTSRESKLTGIIADNPIKKRLLQDFQNIPH